MDAETQPAPATDVIGLDRQIDILREQIFILEGMFANRARGGKLSDRANTTLASLRATLSVLRYLREHPLREGHYIVEAATRRFPADRVMNG